MQLKIRDYAVELTGFAGETAPEPVGRFFVFPPTLVALP